MGCSYCGKPKVFARGLCQGCYYRLRRNGTLERKNVVNSGRCSSPGCTKAAFAKNLCAQHYAAADHPLKQTWKLLRSRARGAYPLEWDDFGVFLEAVGDRPHPKSQLRRQNPAVPWSKENAFWTDALAAREDYFTPEQRADYERDWRFRKKFGITLTEYASMFAGQGGVCAICSRPPQQETRSGKIRDLAVDHCHTSGQVRGLLCTHCNRLLGFARDDAQTLRRAADYLDRHASKLIAKPPQGGV